MYVCGLDYPLCCNGVARHDRRPTIAQFDGFQEAVMPFLLERTKSKKLTEGEMRAMFDEIDTNRYE